MTIAAPRSIASRFSQLHAEQRVGLVPFLPAGYPDLPTTVAAIRAIDAVGPAVIEIGFPFSDPIADGPVIQEAFTAALAKKIKVADIFSAIGKISESLSTPLAAMLSYSMVFRHGTEQFCKAAKAAGFSALILPDLPPPEAQRICGMVRDCGLDTILLVAPTTPTHRRKEIVKLCSGFVYYLSVSGITGERDRLPADLGKGVTELRGMTDLPICVGFGIHTAAQVADVCKIADAAIVGSAIVKKIRHRIDQPGLDQSPQVIAQTVGNYCRELIGSTGVIPTPR
jgi:tryptophan synthase alpha chain